MNEYEARLAQAHIIQHPALQMANIWRGLHRAWVAYQANERILLEASSAQKLAANWEGQTLLLTQEHQERMWEDLYLPLFNHLGTHYALVELWRSLEKTSFRKDLVKPFRNEAKKAMWSSEAQTLRELRNHIAHNSSAPMTVKLVKVESEKEGWETRIPTFLIDAKELLAARSAAHEETDRTVQPAVQRLLEAAPEWDVRAAVKKFTHEVTPVMNSIAEAREEAVRRMLMEDDELGNQVCIIFPDLAADTEDAGSAVDETR